MTNESSDSPDIVLGEEFLTWLWFTSDTAPSFFKDAKGEPFSVSMEQRIVVQSGEGATRETTSVSGPLSSLREARVGLWTGKKVTRALIRLEKGDFAFQFTLRAADFAISGLKTPKVASRDDDEPDGMILEKIYLIETCLELLDNLYQSFLSLRISSQWEKAVAGIQKWLAQSA